MSANFNTPFYFKARAFFPQGVLTNPSPTSFANKRKTNALVKNLRHGFLVEGENEHRKVVGNRPRSLSNIEHPRNKHEQESRKRYVSLPVRKQSAPISPVLTLKSHTYTHAETRELTNKKPLSKQLEDVKDLRYLRSGKYSSETMDMNSNMSNDSPEW